MTNSRGISAGTIAEHVIAVTLVLFRKFPLTFQSQAAREWAQNAVLASRRFEPSPAPVHSSSDLVPSAWHRRGS